MSLGGIVKFVVLCLVVGLVLAGLGMGAEDFWKWMAGSASAIGDWLYAHGEWAIPYVLVGAGVLAPLYFVRYLVRHLRGRRN